MTIQSIHVTYFSGTGGVRRIVDAFEQECARRGVTVSRKDLDHSIDQQRRRLPETNPADSDLLVLFFPIHAFDAPAPVYTWIDQTRFDGQTVAVISVSGGGEAWPNTGCRDNCCRAIEAKGGKVVYERMLCMPSNWTTEVNDHLAMHLLLAIPRKVNLVLDELLAGKLRRTSSRLSSIRAAISQMEKDHACEFPQQITITDKCTGCGICENHCPVENIHLSGRRPVFANSCIMCFRCIYACPAHAMQTNNFMVLKKGYDLDKVEERMQGVELEPIEKCARGLVWASVRDYLLDRDK